MSSSFYARLREARKDDAELAACIDRVVKQLEDVSTTSERPGRTRLIRCAPARRTSYSLVMS